MKRISKTYIPFALVLVLFISTVVWLDTIAVTSNDDALVIKINENSLNGADEEVDQSETEASLLVSDQIWMKDSVFQLGMKAKDKRQWKRALVYFKLANKKFPKSDIANHIGSVYLKQGKYKKANAYFDKVLISDSLNYNATLNKAIISVKIHQLKKAHIFYDKAIQLQSKSPIPYLNKGILLVKENEYENALNYLKKATALSSGRVKSKAMSFLGISYAGVGDTTNAKINLNEAINLGPSATFPRLELANLTANNEEKIEIYEKVLKLNENSSLAHFYTAKVYQNQKELTKAEEHMAKALELNPSDDQIVSAWADILILQERLGEAQNVLNKYNSQKDTLPTTYFYLAKLEVRKKNFQGALDLYKKAIIKSGSDYPEAALNRGIILKNQGKLLLAIQSYKEAIAMKNNYPAAHYNLGILYNKQNEIDKAIHHYNKAISFEPRMYKAYYNLARLYLQTNQNGKAEQALKNAIKIQPNYEKAWLKLAKIYEAQKEDEKLISTYEKMVKKFPGNVAIYIKYGRSILDGHEEIQKAQAIAEKGILIEPDNEKLLVLLGDIQLRLKEPEEAIQYYNSALEIKPNQSGVHFKIGELHMKQGASPLAIKSFQRVVVLTSKNKQAFNYLFTLLNDDPLALNKVKYEYYKEYKDGKEMYAVARELNKLKELNLAIRAYKYAWNQGEQTSWCSYWTGKCYQDQNELSKAKKYYKRALKIKKSHKFSMYRLTQVYQIENDNDNYNKYAKKLIDKYPEFAAEKGIKI